jgi:hypothetical protein
MKRNRLVILMISAGAAVVLFLVAALAIGGFSWYQQLQAENRQRAEAEAAQKAAAEAAAARLAAVQLNIEQASRHGDQGKGAQQSDAQYGKQQELLK